MKIIRYCDIILIMKKMNNLHKNLIVYIICLITIFTLTGCKESESRELIYFDEVFSITPYACIYTNSSKEKYDTKRIKEEVDKCLSELDNKFNVNKEDSLISKVNKDASNERVEIDNEFASVLNQALEVSRNVTSEYDVTIYPVTKVWDFKNKYFKNNNYESIPDDSLITEAINSVGYENVIVTSEVINDVTHYYVNFSNKDTLIDLGSIAKGYAADKVSEILKGFNVNNGLINIGGNVYTFGDRLYKVGITTPFYETLDSDTNMVGYVACQGEDYTYVTSGTYERYIKTNDGKMYHHILSPSTGYPVDNDLLSVTVIIKRDNEDLISTSADALSTAIYTMGLDKGLEYVNKDDKLNCIFITKDKHVIVSDGIKNIFVFNKAVEKYDYNYICGE